MIHVQIQIPKRHRPQLQSKGKKTINHYIIPALHIIIRKFNLFFIHKQQPTIVFTLFHFIYYLRSIFIYLFYSCVAANIFGATQISTQ